jgi:stage IV sporulation protein FB
MLDSSGLFSVLLLAAVVHEFGHFAAIKLLGSRLTELRLELTGAVISFDHNSVTNIGEAVIALAGPLFGVIAAVIAAYLDFSEFAGVSLFLSALNLLPSEQLDGGRLVKLIFASETISLIVHCITCFGLLLLGLYVMNVTGGNFTCLLLALWLLVSALRKR